MWKIKRTIRKLKKYKFLIILIMIMLCFIIIGISNQSHSQELTSSGERENLRF